MFKFFRRLKALKTVTLQNPNSEFYFSKETNIAVSPNSSIFVNGRVKLGYTLPGFDVELPSYNCSVLKMEENSRLIFEGDTFIAPGACIWIKKNATLVFRGNNFIARNTTLIVSNKIEYGLNSSSSWNFCGIDDDGHVFHHTDGMPIQRSKRELLIGENVAIQVNVTIPKGINIGEGSIIGANTVVRQNIPPMARVYSKQDLDIKEGITYGFQFVEK